MDTTHDEVKTAANPEPGPAPLGENPDIAQADPDGPSEGAPFGWMVDPVTRERRPRKKPGRAGLPGHVKRAGPGPGRAGGPPLPPGQSPSLDDLKGQKREKPTDDRPPGKARKGRKRRAPVTAENVPPFRAGPIATGMNRLYAKAGKIVKVMDADIGSAILAVTRKEADDDVTVGEAWEELARTNPRIRAALLKLIQGGAWGQLIWVHAPIFLAIIMKDAIAKHIPFMKLIEAVLTEDDGGPSDLSKMMGGLTQEDMAQAMAFAQTVMGPMAANMQRNGGTPRPPTVPVFVEPEGAEG